MQVARSSTITVQATCGEEVQQLKETPSLANGAATAAAEMAPLASVTALLANVRSPLAVCCIPQADHGSFVLSAQ